MIACGDTARLLDIPSGKQRGTFATTPVTLIAASADGIPAPLTDKRRIVGHGIVGDSLWLVSASDDGAEIWAP